jgi:hypothetical protein
MIACLTQSIHHLVEDRGSSGVVFKSAEAGICLECDEEDTGLRLVLLNSITYRRRCCCPACKVAGGGSKPRV